MVSKDTGLLERTFVSEAFFYLHIINQFETRDRDYVVLDICCYRDAKMLDCLFVDAMKVRKHIITMKLKNDWKLNIFLDDRRTCIRIQIMPRCFVEDR